MNNIQELIGRIKFRIKKLSGPGYLMPNCVADLRDALAVLESMQAPLPDDVKAMIDYQNSVALVYGNERDRDIGDLLERLAYENQCHILARKEDRRRIEGLEYKLGEAVKIAEREVDYRKRLDAALAKLIRLVEWRIERFEDSEITAEDALRRIKAELPEAKTAKESQSDPQERYNRLEAALAELRNHVWADIGDQRFFNRVYEKARAGE
jgi:hypothetical protein